MGWIDLAGLHKALLRSGALALPSGGTARRMVPSVRLSLVWTLVAPGVAIGLRGPVQVTVHRVVVTRVEDPG